MKWLKKLFGIKPRNVKDAMVAGAAAGAAHALATGEGSPFKAEDVGEAPDVGDSGGDASCGGGSCGSAGCGAAV